MISSVPNLFLSADSGFDGMLLLDTCTAFGEAMPVTPICVPKKSNLIACGNFKGKLSEFIEKEFLPQEAAHIKSHSLGKDQDEKEKPPPFTLRIKANYVSKKQLVVQEFLPKAFQATKRLGFFKNPTTNYFRGYRKTVLD